MMNRLRIAMSLHPRADARDRDQASPARETLPYPVCGFWGPDAQASGQAAAYMRPYFLKVSAQSWASPSSASFAVPSPPTTNG